MYFMNRVHYFLGILSTSNYSFHPLSMRSKCYTKYPDCWPIRHKTFAHFACPIKTKF